MITYTASEPATVRSARMCAGANSRVAKPRVEMNTRGFEGPRPPLPGRRGISPGSQWDVVITLRFRIVWPAGLGAAGAEGISRRVSLLEPVANTKLLTAGGVDGPIRDDRQIHRVPRSRTQEI